MRSISFARIFDFDCYMNTADFNMDPQLLILPKTTKRK